MTWCRALFGLGFTPAQSAQAAGTLSGGEKTRLMLARLLVGAHDLLLLDEPTNHLDIAMLQWLEDYLRAYRGAYLVISHDRRFLDQSVTRILELDDGAQVTLEPGDTVVQNGTRHAWRNPFDEPATFVVTLVGAHHDRVK